MVKTVSIAFALVLFLVAESHGQEVFSGDQKARPKYPKAQPLASDHGKPDLHAEKAIPVQANKPAVATKSNAPGKPATAVAVKAAAPSPKLSDASNKAASNTATVHKDLLPTKTAGVQPPPSAASPKLAPKVEIAAIKDEAVAPPAEGPNQKSKNASKTAPVKTSSLAAQTAKSLNTATSKTQVATSGSSPKVEIVPAKPAAGKADLKTSAKASAAVAAAIGNGKSSGAKNSVAEKSVPHASPAPVSPAKVSGGQRPALPGQHISTDGAERKTMLADQPRKDQKTDIKISTSVATSGPAGSRKETTTLSSSDKTTSVQNSVVETTLTQPVANHFDTAFTKLADGFDFPVGKPDAQGYYKARGFRSHGHLGEDWDGVRGGDTDLGDPIYSIGDGLVVFARDCHMGWGNVLIVRHSYREGGKVKTVDALYGHLQSMLVHRGQAVTRGQKVATMGNAHGLYDAHLHLEIRRNLEIGMSRAAFAQDFSNYYDPTQFIQEHRHLQTGGGSYRVAMNTFTRDARIKWDKVRNYSHARTGGGSSQSAAALKKALATGQ